MIVPERNEEQQSRLARDAKPGSSESRSRFRWADTISSSEWEIYRSAIHCMRQARIPFLLGGGFALATFIGHWRDTKDIDFYILPKHRKAAMNALTKAGFKDYFSQLPYDRKWIYRSICSKVIVDIIWSMANQHAQVDEQWFENAGEFILRGENLQVVPMEEFVWCKLYILQRDHCDWTDIFNLIFCRGKSMNWERLMTRLADDIPLLKAVLCVYAWLCPQHARQLPGVLWRRLGLRPATGSAPKLRSDRIRLLDSRGWFTALIPKHKKLEV